MPCNTNTRERTINKSRRKKCPQRLASNNHILSHMCPTEVPNLYDTKHDRLQNNNSWKMQKVEYDGLMGLGNAKT